MVRLAARIGQGNPARPRLRTSSSPSTSNRPAAAAVQRQIPAPRPPLHSPGSIGRQVLNRPPAAFARALLLCAAGMAGASLALGLSAQAAAVAPGDGFDMGNKLYEQGKFREAAATYETVARSGIRAEALYFNLGNAWFKAGQLGRAIAAWRQAESVSPRDPSIRFNLQFARKQVSGTEPPPAALGQRLLRALTLNEWGALASIALWLWFGLLALREFRPALKPALTGYTATAGIVLLALAVALGAAIHLQLGTTEAVTIAPETLARSGPLDEAKVLHQFRDGTEVTVLDRKDIPGDGNTSWLQIRDAAGRTGWVRAGNVILINPAPSNATEPKAALQTPAPPEPPARPRLPPTPFKPDSTPAQSPKTLNP